MGLRSFKNRGKGKSVGVSTGPRRRALELMLSWEGSGLSLDRLRDEMLKNPFPDRRDQGFFLALTNGTVRWLGYIDWIIGQYSKHPVSRLQPLVLQVLRLGLYQLIFMDRVPAAAAINEAVKLVHLAGQPRWIKGFVNGLLRRVEREKARLPKAGNGGADDSVIRNHQLHSHPAWLFERWRKRYGLAVCEAVCQKNNQEAKLTLRAQGISADQLIQAFDSAGIEARRGQFADGAVVLPYYRGAIPLLPGFRDGLFQVQDEAAQLVSLLLGHLEPGARYLDGCAGLGGKTTDLAGRMPEGCRLIAVEPDSRRHGLLGENLVRLGLDGRVERFAGSLEQLEDSAGFDGVLIDAPCSGLGVIRRHPDIRWNTGERDLEKYHHRQIALLASAAARVKPGGVLLYVTCSTEPEENEQVIEDFIKTADDFRVADCRSFLPENCENLISPDGFFVSRPDQGLDGFFAARLLRTERER